MISKRDPVTGELRKRQFGPWMLTAFKMLAKFKGLRGGALDMFSKTEERRHERQLIDDYVKLLDEIAAKAESGESRRRGRAREHTRRDPRLRPRQGAQRQGGEGARGKAAARLSQPAAGAASRLNQTGGTA